MPKETVTIPLDLYLSLLNEVSKAKDFEFERTETETEYAKELDLILRKAYKITGIQPTHN